MSVAADYRLLEKHGLCRSAAAGSWMWLLHLEPCTRSDGKGSAEWVDWRLPPSGEGGKAFTAVYCRVRGSWSWTLGASRSCCSTQMPSLSLFSSVGLLFAACCTILELVQKATCWASVSDRMNSSSLLPMGGERALLAPPKQTKQKPLFCVQASPSNNDLLLTTHSFLCLSPWLFVTFTHCILLNGACIFLTHRSCIFIHLL